MKQARVGLLALALAFGAAACQGDQTPARRAADATESPGPSPETNFEITGDVRLLLSRPSTAPATPEATSTAAASPTASPSQRPVGGLAVTLSEDSTSASDCGFTRGDTVAILFGDTVRLGDVSSPREFSNKRVTARGTVERPRRDAPCVFVADEVTLATSASPSVSPRVTSSPGRRTATPRATATPRRTATPTASPRPTATATATASPSATP